MTTFVEDFSTWDTGALITVPPESLETADLIALVIEVQDRLKRFCNRQKTPHEEWTEK